MQFTWRQLAEAIHNLEPEQLDMQVMLALEDNDHFEKVYALQEFGLDIYRHKDDEDDAGDLESLKLTHGEDFKLDEYELITPANTPILLDSFNFMINEEKEN